MAHLKGCYTIAFRKIHVSGISFSPYYFFAIRYAPQDSLKYSPFELVLGCNPWGPPQALRDKWENPGENIRTAEPYCQEFQNRLQVAQQLAHENLEKAKHQQKERYDTRAKLREFREGQKVLVLWPTSTSYSSPIGRTPLK